MANKVEVDMLKVATRIFGDKTIMEGKAFPISAHTILHRFEGPNGESAHIVVDGAGGYQAVVHPGVYARVVKQGHLSEFVEQEAPRLCDQFGDNGVWNEHPDYSRSDWSYEVSNNDTNLGYWDWVEHRVESNAHDQETDDEGMSPR